MAASYRDRAVYYRALSALLGAGAPGSIALRAAADGLRSGPLRSAATDAAFRAGSGVGVGEALAHHPDVFEESDVALLRAGEASGTLDRALHRLAEDADTAGSIRRRLVAGFTYPIILWHFAALVPPLSHLIVDGFTAWFLRVIALLIPLYLVLAVLWWLGSSLQGRVIRSRLLCRIPLVGKALRRASLARFLRVLASSLDAGMGAVESATAAVSSTTQPDLRRGGRAGIAVLTAGNPFAKFFSFVPGLSGNDHVLLRSGETAGALVESLRRVSVQQEEASRLSAEAAVRYIPLVVYLLVAGYIALTIIRLYMGQLDSLRSL